MRACERKSPADAKANAGVGGDAPGIVAEILLQPVVQMMVKQLCP